MLRTAIFGNIEISKIVKEFIEDKYNPAAKSAGGEEMTVVCYSLAEGCKESTDLPKISLEQTAYEMKNCEIDVLIIPKDNAIGQSDLPWRLTSEGALLDNVYYGERISKTDTTDETEILDFFTPFLDTKYLGYLEYHVADQCNLNCKACEHYSALVKEDVFPDFAKFEKDFTRLHDFIDDIGLIRILGGEPLLNKDINKYIRLTRSLYPSARIFVVTNGLKLMSMNNEFYDTLKECNGDIYISYYPPMKETMDKVENLLQEKEVSYTISTLNLEFGKKQILKPLDDEQTLDAFFKCTQKVCNNFYDGKLASCFLPFTTKYFNGYFDKNLPEDGAIDLYEEGLTTRDLRERLLLPFERCRYCSGETEMIPWDVAHEPSILEDWIRS